LTVADRALHFTGNPEADAYLVSEPLALLIGFVLDQQITVQHAFSGPLVLRQRLGHLDPKKIAAMDPDALAAVFRERPALHRYPNAMARRVADLCRVVVAEYAGDARRVWTDARDGHDLQQRLLALPSIGPMKARGLVAILHRRLGVDLPGMAEVLPTHPTLGDVDSDEALAAYQANKRARKAAMKAAAAAS
jgi:uncharacterized HhH-GPD family protein